MTAFFFIIIIVIRTKKCSGVIYMQTIKYKITDENGIHARPAGLLVKAATGFTSDFKLKKGEKHADAKRLFGVMSLGIKQGDEIVIEISGDDEDAAREKIEEFLSSNL